MRSLDIDKMSRCKNCPTLGDTHVPASGSPIAKVMVIGWFPGKNDIDTGQPFSGPNGEVLDFFFEEAGIPRDQIYFTNVVKCHPASGVIDDAVPGMCRKTWLSKEIKHVDPTVVVLVGKDTHAYITGGKEFAHASISRTKKRSYFTIDHPSHFLRSGMIDTFIGTADLLKRLIDESDTA